MKHARQDIRERLRAALSDIDGIYDSIVFDSAEIPDAPESPWVYVWLGDEEAEAFTLGDALRGRKLERTAVLNIDIFGRASGSGLDAIEGIAADAEARVFASRRLGGVLTSCTFSGMAIERTNDGSAPLVRLRMSWDITYITTEADPSSAV